MFRNTFHVIHRGIGKIFVGIAHSVFGSPPAYSHGRGLGVFGVHEEEEFVLHNRTSESETVGGVAVAVPRTGDFNSGNLIAAHVLVAVVNIGGTLEGVRS